jgi:hypothetical protein
MRILSILLWGLAVGGMVVLGREVWEDDEAPLLGAALLAFSPCVLWQAWNARPYALALALEVWASVFFVRTFISGRFQRRDYLLFLATTLAGLLTHYHFAVPAMMMLAASLCGPRRRLALWSAVGLTVAFALIACPLLARQGFQPGWIPRSTWTTPFTTLIQFNSATVWIVLAVVFIAGLRHSPRSPLPARPLLLATVGVWLLPILVGHFFGVFWPPRQGVFLAPWLMTLLSGPIARGLRQPGGAMLIMVLWASGVNVCLPPLTLGPTHSEYQAVTDCAALGRPGDLVATSKFAAVTVGYYLPRLAHGLRWVGSPELVSALQRSQTPARIFWIGEPDDPVPGWLGRHFNRIQVLSYADYPLVPPDRAAWSSVLEVFEPRGTK